MAASTQTVLDSLRAHEAELRAVGVRGLALFGSTVRGDAAAGSDVDLVVRLGPEFSRGGFDTRGLSRDAFERDPLRRDVTLYSLLRTAEAALRKLEAGT